MGSSMNSMPAFWHVAISTALIGRDASLISVSARQNFWKPPPVPDVPTVGLTPGLLRWNSSAIASLMGKTVLDPSILIDSGELVSRLSPSPDEPPQPTAKAA